MRIPHFAHAGLRNGIHKGLCMHHSFRCFAAILVTAFGFITKANRPRAIPAPAHSQGRLLRRSAHRNSHASKERKNPADCSAGFCLIVGFYGYCRRAAKHSLQ